MQTENSGITSVVSSVKLCKLVLTSTFFAFQFSYRPFFRMCFILFDFLYGKGRCFSFINLNVFFYQFFSKFRHFRLFILLILLSETVTGKYKVVLYKNKNILHRKSQKTCIIYVEVKDWGQPLKSKLGTRISKYSFVVTLLESSS